MKHKSTDLSQHTSDDYRPAVLTFGVWVAIVVLCFLSRPCLAQKPFDLPAVPVLKIDLLMRIDLKRDMVNGEYLLANGVLTTPSIGNARLNLQYEPPVNYDLDLDIKRKTPNDSFTMLVVLSGRQVLIMCHQGVTGVTLVDGHDLASEGNVTAYRHPTLQVGQVTRFRCQVRGHKLKVQVGEKTIIDWSGDVSRTYSPVFWGVPNHKSLMIGSHLATFEISRIEITVLPLTALCDSLSGVATLSNLTDTQEANGRTAIRQVFKREFDAAKNVNGKLILSETLASRSGECRDNKVKFYAMLAEAAENAAAAGDLPLAMKSVAEAERNFESSALALREKVYRLISPQMKTADQIVPLVESELSIMRDAFAVDDLDVAENAAQSILALSRKPGMGILKDQLGTLTREVTPVKAAREAIDPAVRTLRQKPDDKESNLAWGRYLCFMKGDWNTGLRFLIKSQQRGIAELAQQDFDQPADPGVNVQLGDAWWEIGDKEKEPARTNICMHAAEAYRRALPGLTGVNASLTERKLLRLFGDSKVTVATGDPQGAILGDAPLNLGAYGTVECWFQTRALQQVLISKRGLDSDSSLAARLYEGRICLAVSGPNSYYLEARSQLTVDDGIWHHLAIVKSDRIATLFVDGKSVAKLEVPNQLVSKSPWKLGTSLGSEPIGARVCKFRVSDTARYIVSFKPDYQYKKDKATVFISDLK